MQRRDFLKISLLSSTVAPALFSCARPHQIKDTAPCPPNIVIIYADDMGYGDLACQNPDSKIPTPNMDKLASQGVRFTDGHSSSGICTPSRYSLLTGRHHWRDFHGIVNAFGPPRFAPGRLTMPEMLKQRGYKTACFGKWHLGWDWNAIKRTEGEIPKGKALKPEDFDWSKPIPGGPTSKGFDYYFGDGTINFPPYCWVENDRVTEMPSEPFDMKGKKTKEGSWEFRPGPMAKDWDPYKVLPTLAERTVAWVNDQQADQPFFLYFALPSPHAPIIPNDEYDGKSDAGAYGDFVFQTDCVAGQVLDALEANGLTENTIVVFTSDNGPEHYAFNRVKKFDHRSMGKLRGLKRDIWEGGHRVPFVIRWPGVIDPGRVNSSIVSQVDLMATFASIVGCGLGDNAAEDSFDLTPLLVDNTDQTVVRDFHIHNTYVNKYAMRKDNWVLIDHRSGSNSRMPDWFVKDNGYDLNTPKGSLHDLSVDIEQKNNLIDKHPEKALELRKLLREIRGKGYSSPRLDK